ncbi:hypothetical protein [Amycolatopsis australiensis]|nr:hypothetical protein [Amycolatopsis australiensis]
MNGIEGPEKLDEALAKRWKSAVANFGVVIVVVTVGLAALRLLFVSKGDWAVIVSLVSAMNVKTILLGSLLPAAPAVFVLITVVLAIYFDNRAMVDASNRHEMDVWKLSCVVLAIILLPFSTFAAAGSAVLMGVLWMFARRFKKRRLERAARSAGPGDAPDAVADRLGLVAVPFGIFLVVLNMLGSPIWLPAELLELKGQPNRVVSVLDSANGDLVLWYDNTTQVVRVKQADVLSRQICDRRGSALWSQSMTFVFNGGPKTPPCP